MNVDRGPLGYLSTKFDRYDVRMHSSGRWNDAPTRRASGRDLWPATPTAGSRTRPRAAFRTLGVLLYDTSAGGGLGGTLWCKENPHHPPHARAAGPPRLAQGVLSIMGGCLGCFGRSDLGPVPSGRGNSASRWPLQLKLGDRRHAHMSSSDAEFQRKRPAGRAATAFFCMP